MFFWENKKQSACCCSGYGRTCSHVSPPLAGAAILQVGDWRDTFWLLSFTGFIGLCIALLFQETLPLERRYHGSLAGSLSRLLAVEKNVGFSWFLVIVAILSAPYMAYIATSSYIYESFFSLDAQSYSYFFATNSAFAILGPLIYIRSIGHVTPRFFSWCCFGIAFVSGLSLFFIGNHSPWYFLLTFLPFTLIEGAIRPFSTDILLDQQQEDIGSASSLINAVHTIFGSIGMVLGTMKWNNMIDGMGITILFSTTLAVIMWAFLMRSKVKVIGLK